MTDDDGVDRSSSSVERLDPQHYGDPEDHRPAHVAPPDEDQDDEERGES